MKALSQSKVAIETAAEMQAYNPALAKIPAEKLSGMWARTILGFVIGLVGLGCIVALVVVPVWIAFEARDTSKISLPLVTVGLSFGLGFVAWGALIASTQLAARPLATVIGTVRGLYRTVRKP